MSKPDDAKKPPQKDYAFARQKFPELFADMERREARRNAREEASEQEERNRRAEAARLRRAKKKRETDAYHKRRPTSRPR